VATRNSRLVRSRLARKLAAYAGVAGLATLGTQVEGAIVYTDLGAGMTIEPRGPTRAGRVVDGTFEIDLDLDGQMDFLMGHWTGWHWKTETVCTWRTTASGLSYFSCYDNEVLRRHGQLGYLSGAGGNRIVLADSAFGVYPPSAARLSQGTTVSPVDPASDTVTLTGSSVSSDVFGMPYGRFFYGEFQNSAGYAGVLFEAGDQQFHTGWLHIQEQSGQLTLFAYAYEAEPGAPILAGDTGASSNVPGDSNGDGVVDLVDLNNVRNNFGATGEDVLGDTNGDEVVDLEDLNAVRNNFGGANPVPEPPSLVLLAAGAAGLATLRRKRRALGGV
jgi:hypothetical protein